MKFILTNKSISVSDISTLIKNKTQIEISDEVIAKVNHCRNYIDQKLINSNRAYYGINTGFGSLYNQSISNDDLEALQTNLVMSHACGVGNEVKEEIVKTMLLLKIIGMAYGNSGIQLETLMLLKDFFNNDILPVVYEQGSLGASGDLAPLAHLCLPLLGLGEVKVDGVKMKASDALQKFNLKPVKLKSKEGLALLNGTQFMSSYGTYSLNKAKQLSEIADVIGALSLEGFDGRIDPFHPLIQEIRPHKGQISTAANIRNLLLDSELIVRNKVHVQDPYAFRCIPQVHGASKDAIHYVNGVFETEVNAVTDNPTVFPDDDLIISAGNFHGQPLAIAMDFLAIAMAELGSISERRTYQLISGLRELPPFLVANPGLNSGFMIPQYTAASIASQNKQLCTPSSVDSIVSSNGQEDHVSMGANAATKLLQVVNNVERILAIELFNAAQALQFRRPLKTSPKLEKLVSEYRKKVPFVDADRILYYDIELSIDFLRTFDFSDLLKK